MKPWLWLAAIISIAGGATEFSPSVSTKLVIVGELNGSLSPCGCVKPMSGGIRRMASVIELLRKGGEVVFIQNGGLVEGRTRQDEMKAETAAQALLQMNVNAIHLGATEAKLGTAMVSALDRLSGQGRFVNSMVTNGESVGANGFIKASPFLIGAGSDTPYSVGEPLGLSTRSSQSAAESLVSEARSAHLIPVMLFQGERAAAEKLARSATGLALITYSGTGEPDRSPTKVGGTWVVSPGLDGKYVLSIDVESGALGSMKIWELGPQFKDSEVVSRTYASYLKRVESERLLEKLPRVAGPGYAGTKACGQCHTSALKVWLASSHARALRTLEVDGHGRDPDCVRCHVVGLDFKTGFITRSSTPQLANVGCESCHGPGKAHAQNPNVQLKAAGERSCASCHVPNHSPNFRFQTYWNKIKHG